MNPIGLISMQYARPFTAEHFPLFKKMRELGFDFVELLVPEPGEIDLAEARRALDDAGLGVVLAARVNLAAQPFIARERCPSRRHRLPALYGRLRSGPRCDDRRRPV